MTQNPPATIVITTRNRMDELRVALQSVMMQTVACEIIVFDDASEDGTSELVRNEFPSVRLFRNEVPKGLIRLRNEGARLATAPIIFSIDDDAAFTTSDIVSRTLQEFEDPRIGAVAIPYSNIKIDPRVYQRAPDGAQIYAVEQYIGLSHAVRRDLFLKLGGYRDAYFHQCEEGDYCLRMLDHGFIVRAGSADPIHHYVSPKRSRRVMVTYNARNHVLYSWQNIPLPWMPLHLAATIVGCLRHDNRHLLWALEGLAKGIGRCLTGRAPRDPVSLQTFWLSRRLKKGPVPLASITLPQTSKADWHYRT